MTSRFGPAIVCLAVALGGCASSSAPAGPPATGSCTPPPAGGRCAGPEPLGSVAVSADGRRLVTVVLCGGSLRVSESASLVRVTYVASSAGPGAMSCARVRLTARLAEPLARRAVVDATGGQPMTVTHCAPSPSRTPGYVLTACG